MKWLLMNRKMASLAALIMSTGMCQGCGSTLYGAFLVRHAEKATSDPSNPDPELTSAGVIRANALKNRLASANIKAIYSTCFKRTIATAKPLADHLGLPINIYHQHPALVAKIKAEHGTQTVLIVGHSNTVPLMVQAFGADPPIPSISEDDFDNLFIVLASSNGKAIFVHDTYGAASP